MEIARKETAIEVVFERCCGLDVHKATVVACLWMRDQGGKIHKEIRTFGTMTVDLLVLYDWLRAKEVTHVAMESTGVFWKPIYNLLEDSFTVLLVNAAHVKRVPGRKTDVTDCEWIADLLAHGLKLPELRKTLDGCFSAHHRLILEHILGHLDFLDEAIEKISGEAAARTTPFDELIQFMDTIPGVDRKAAEGTIAEIGLDMERFPTHRHLASWTGLCPSNNESAGKRKKGRTRKGDQWFKRYAIEMALAASRTKGTYLNALYHRLVRRKGHKKAIVAVAHAILVIIYLVLKHRVPYRERGADYFDKLNTTHIKRHHLKRLESLGFKVTLEPLEIAA